ncbi:MAG: hypothetical protein OXC37_06285 [Bdellovibrionaceae bacterium]|nr:hypothetical protein [Pseudobdellovibrionaceae bacterium]
MLNLFGSKKTSEQELITEALSELLEGGKLLLSFQAERKDQALNIDIFGEDEGLLKTKKGKLLLAIQIYLSQVAYKNYPDEKIRISIDSNGFWKEQEEKLLSLTDRLIEKALSSNKPIAFKQALSPFQRRLIHEKVSGNTGVRSQSYGSGVYKKLKLIPDTFRNDKE